MDSERISTILAAAGHPTRFEVLRLLSGENDGLAAGEIGRRLEVGQSTLSSHRKKLADAGLVSTTRSGTTISYRLNRSTAGAVGKALSAL